LLRSPVKAYTDERSKYYSMIHVELTNIITNHEAIRRGAKLFEEVEHTKEVMVVTINNKPAVALIDIAQLEALTGKSVTPVAPLARPLGTLPAEFSESGVYGNHSLNTPTAVAPVEHGPLSEALPDIPNHTEPAPQVPTEPEVSTSPEPSPESEHRSLPPLPQLNVNSSHDLGLPPEDLNNSSPLG
jgi:prevent-host-death family protein